MSVLVSQYETDHISGWAELKKKGEKAYITDALMVLKADLKTIAGYGRNHMCRKEIISETALAIPYHYDV